MTCYDCHHNTPAGCALARNEYETMTECDAHVYEPGSDEEETDIKQD